jgi:hypothetical protein
MLTRGFTSYGSKCNIRPGSAFKASVNCKNKYLQGLKAVCQKKVQMTTDLWISRMLGDLRAGLDCKAKNTSVPRGGKFDKEDFGNLPGHRNMMIHVRTLSKPLLRPLAMIAMEFMSAPSTTTPL